MIVLVYFVVVHVIESDVLGPHIVGKSIGLHPVVSLAALLAGAELFGIWGRALRVAGRWGPPGAAGGYLGGMARNLSPAVPERARR